MQGKSDAACYSVVLFVTIACRNLKYCHSMEIPKQYKMFMASFQSNVAEMLDEGDDKLKLTLLLQHCTGKALQLIDDCVMLPPDAGYAKAIEKLEKRFGKTHKIAQSYIEGVIKGAKLELNDVDALVQLADDMEKCQTVLQQLKFASDLDSTGTLRSIVERLPDCLQTQWVRRSYKIFDGGTEPTFRDLTKFVEAKANEYSSKYGQYYAERMLENSKEEETSVQQKSRVRENESNQCATTLTTETESTAGRDSNRPRCLFCDRVGHIIWKCYNFKKLSIAQRRSAVSKLDLCDCCLKHGHKESNCDRTCWTCGGDHHSLLHTDDNSKNDNDQENQNDN